MAVGKILPRPRIGGRLPRALSPRVPNIAVRTPQLPAATNIANRFQPNFVFETDARKLKRLSDTVNKKIDGAYMYIGKAIRQKARQSIRKSTKTEPHSRPGTPVKSRTRIYPDTIYRYYNPSKKTLLVGPKTTSKYGKMPDGSKILQGKTLPQMLEYGGIIHAPRPTFIHRNFADPRALKAYWRKERSRRYGGAKRKPRKKKAYLLRDVKFVVIPPGYRQVDPRPTMRLAQNKVLTYQSLKYAFDRIGVSDPDALRNDISGLRI